MEKPINPAENLKETIEILTPDQWQEYREIRLKAFETDPTSFGESYENEAKKSEQQLRAVLENPNYKNYIAKIGDKIVATAQYSLSSPENVQHCAMISSVFTDPDFRGRGLGEKLMKRIISDLHADPKISRLRLSVGVIHTAAREMYKKLGFLDYGIGHKEMKVAGKYYDQVHMELFFEDKL